jgi:hypothetical protein
VAVSSCEKKNDMYLVDTLLFVKGGLLRSAVLVRHFTKTKIFHYKEGKSFKQNVTKICYIMKEKICFCLLFSCRKAEV